MSKRVRQLIFLAVFCLSAVGLTAILLYSAGYGFNFHTWKLQPTGSIRIAVEPKDDVLIQLLPVGTSDHGHQASFTHLLPGIYHLHVEAPNYQPVNLELTVEPNTTLLIEPLRLWPLLTKPAQTKKKAPLEVEVDSLSIALQAAVSQLEILKDETKILPVDSSTIAVLNRQSGVVQLLTQSGNIIQSRQLGIAQDIQYTDRADAMLLVSQFALERVDLHTSNSETIIRLSTPISAAAWIGSTPYLAYSKGQEIHLIDSRAATHYSDQVIAEHTTPVSALWYDVESDELNWMEAEGAYALPLRADK